MCGTYKAMELIAIIFSSFRKRWVPDLLQAWRKTKYFNSKKEAAGAKPTVQDLPDEMF
jgi:hypothetical protein